MFLEPAASSPLICLGMFVDGSDVAFGISGQMLLEGDSLIDEVRGGSEARAAYGNQGKRGL